MIMPACWCAPPTRWVDREWVKKTRKRLAGKLPMTVVLLRELEEGILVSELCCRIGFALSRDEGHVFIWRRDIGVQGWTVIDEELVITDADLVDGGILLTLTGTTFHWVEGRANLKGGNNENT